MCHTQPVLDSTPATDTGLFGATDGFLRDMGLDASAEVVRLGGDNLTVDMIFLVYLRKMARFGYFRFGPITIDVRLIEEIVEREVSRHGESGNSFGDDAVRFSQELMEEVRRSGGRRIDELHCLLALMKVGEGLPARVFGELGVTPAQVAGYASRGPEPTTESDRLYSPEDAAEYLGVHVQTVRSWIRSGRLRASRLAGQRALRITATDLKSVLEPIEPGDL